MLCYHDLAYSAYHGLEPNMKQVLFPDIAPCHIWLVPPGFRVARLSDLSKAAGHTSAIPEVAEELLRQLGIAYAAKIILTGPWQGPVATWKQKDTDEYLILWQSGAR